MEGVSWLWIALLAASVVVLIGAEWPRLSGNLGAQARAKRERARRKQQFKLLKTRARSSPRASSATCRSSRRSKKSATGGARARRQRTTKVVRSTRVFGRMRATFSCS